MTIPTPRIFANPQSLPFKVAQTRLLGLDKSVEMTAFQQGMAGAYTNHLLVFSTLTDTEITNALAPAQTAAETTALATKSNGPANRSTALVASGLLGTNISAVNSNAQRDALMKSICMALSICDDNGVIINI